MTDYAPIACDSHAELELLALRRSRVRLEAVDDSGVEIACSGHVVDVLSRDGAEFLVVETDTERADLRLDRLRRIFDAKGELVWRQESDVRQ